VSPGYYESANLATIDNDLSSASIITGVAIFGVSGTAVEASGNAAVAEVLDGKTFSKAEGESPPGKGVPK